MKRKANLTIRFILAVLTGFATLQGAAQAQSRPNVVVFVADDLGVEDIGPYGNRIVRTPHLDKLAEESLLFSAAFAASATCSPSRAALWTGMYPFHNGAHANHTGIREGVQTLPARLKTLGYRAAIAGKYHIGPMEAYPFEMIHGTNVPEPGHEKDGVLWTDLELGPVDQWLAEVAGKKDPFVLVVNDHSPHVIWPENPEYDADRVDIPSRHIDTRETRRARARYYTDITKMDRNVGRLLSILESHGLDDNTMVIFTADQGPQWAFGKWGLYDYGVAVPLLVKWPGVVSGGESTDALVSLVDIVPTILELAEGEVPEEVDGLSLLPLLRGSNRSLRESVYATHTGDGSMNRTPMRMIRTKRYKYILNLAPEVTYTTHMDRSKDHDGGRTYWDSWVQRSFENPHAASVLWRYHNRPAEELYDVLADPDEQRNLAREPHYAEVLEKFRAEMQTWRTQQGDRESGPYEEPKEKPQKPIAPYIFK
ncbi:MAG: sulfatase [Solitalea sp.]